MRVYKIIASVSGIGYIGKGSGTVASLVTCFLWMFLPAGKGFPSWQVFLTAFTVLIGIWAAGKVEAEWGKDSSKVVIDEVAGMMITLLFLPVTKNLLLAGLVLFRFFDIAKPLFIKRLERLPGGWGVMGDDLLAGLYANLVLQALATFNFF